MERKKQIKLLYKGYELDKIPSEKINFDDFIWIADPRMVDAKDINRLFTEIYVPDKQNYYLSVGLKLVNRVAFWLMKKDVFDNLKIKENKHDR